MKLSALNRKWDRRFERLEARILEAGRSSSIGYRRYRDDPVGYVRDVLKVKLTPDQVAILEGLAKPPYRVLAKAGHEVGKTLTGACAASWWFDTRVPSICLTTAPNFKQVKDLLWKEVRRLRLQAGLGGFVGPKLPRLELAPDHFAVGVTATSSAAIQGHHGPAVLVIIDEAVGVPREIWDAVHTMAHSLLATFNPTDTTSAAFQEETQAERPYTVLTMSQLSHPNIAAHLKGEPLPIPHAVKPQEMEINLRAWSQPIAAEQAKPASDVEWPPGSGQWLRPGPLAEARILGRWPSQGTYGVWSDADWLAANRPAPAPGVSVLPRIGLDVAVFGDDWTAFHVRVGPVSMAHEAYNGRDTDHTIGRAVQLAEEWVAWANAKREEGSEPFKVSDIVFVVDSGGIGADLPSRMRTAGLTVVGVNAGTSPHRPSEYPNKRSELWFDAAERARTGHLFLSNLPADVKRRLRQQAMAPRWKLDAAGRRVVEPKDKTKQELGRSPDDMDGMNLSYYEGVGFEKPAVIPNPARTLEPDENAGSRRGLFGAR